MSSERLTDLPNIGKTVAQRLEAVGIRTRKQLERFGSAGAYRKLRRRFAGQSLPVCYYLYSLEGALQGRHWDDFSDDEKRVLRRTAGLDNNRRGMFATRWIDEESRT